MTRYRNKKMILLTIVFTVLALIVVWFIIPYSPTKSKFLSDVENLKSTNKIDADRLFEQSDFEMLPMPIQKYIEGCGYIGTHQMSYMCMKYNDVDFKQGRSGPSLTIDYTQYNFVSKPARMALIESSMFGIPFEGYDYYSDGTGGMKGVIAKVITLFNQTGTDMDKACLATFLAECLFEPSVLLQDYITFEEIDDYHVRATISYGGQTASGVFTFNDNYEYISFTTNDRAVSNSDGTMEYIPWTAECSNYQISDSGIKYPTNFSAIWNYTDGDFIYFDGVISSVSYDK
ncbi:MAG: hypothetical protein MJ172_11290 [Clostridia bacterium]|nr:hypothetical protein [Clostridia bacterium]